MHRILYLPVPHTCRYDLQYARSMQISMRAPCWRINVHTQRQKKQFLNCPVDSPFSYTLYFWTVGADGRLPPNIDIDDMISGILESFITFLRTGVISKCGAYELPSPQLQPWRHRYSTRQTLPKVLKSTVDLLTKGENLGP